MGCGTSTDKGGKFYGGAISKGTNSISLRSRTTKGGNSSYGSSIIGRVRTDPRQFFQNNRNFPDGDPNQGSLKKRLRRKLRSQIKSGSQEELEETLRKYEDFKVEADDLYFEAIRRVEYLRMRNALKEAVRRRHYSTLRDAIDRVDQSPYAKELTNSLLVARRLLNQLKRQWDGQPVRLGMGYSTVSEVRRFKSPPGSVVDSVKACYLLVGTQPRHLKSWPMIRALMGNVGLDGILTRMARFDASKVDLKHYKIADALVRKWDEQEVANVSLEAASFWTWANSSLDKKYTQISRNSKK